MPGRPRSGAPVHVPVRYGRRPDEALLDQPVRNRILTVLRCSPGLNVSRLCAAVGAKWGAVQYHLYRLERGGWIHPHRFGRSKNYFPVGFDASLRGSVSLVRHGRVFPLARLINGEPGLSQETLSVRTGIPRRILALYVGLLEACGLVRVVRDRRRCLHHPTPALGGLVAALEPSATAPDVSNLPELPGPLEIACP